jgi:SAM-dependent methyltransferase
MTTQPFDPVAFKAAQRADWQVAAPGWRKWYDMLEAGGEIVSRTLVERAEIGPGDSVLDVATGYGEPALTAARLVAPTGRVVATDIAPDMLDFGRERATQAGLDNVEFLEVDAEALSFDDEAFDAILCRQGLQFSSRRRGDTRAPAQPPQARRPPRRRRLGATGHGAVRPPGVGHPHSPRPAHTTCGPARHLRAR